MTIDYRALLKKYIAHVVDYESTDYLDDFRRDSPGATVSFTDQEWAELRAVAEYSDQDADSPRRTP